MRVDHYHHLSSGTEELLIGLMEALRAAVHQNGEAIMAKIDDEAAAIAANTATLKMISQRVNDLSDGHSTISDEIADLRAQIAAGQAPDFTALDAAVADQTSAIGALTTLVPPADTAPPLADASTAPTS